MEHITISVADIEVEASEQDSEAFVLGGDNNGGHAVDLDSIEAILRKEQRAAATVSVNDFLCTLASEVPGINVLQPVLGFINAGDTAQEKAFKTLSSLSLHLLSTSELSLLFSTDINSANLLSSHGSTSLVAENVSETSQPAVPSRLFSTPLIVLYSLCNVSCLLVLLIAAAAAMCYSTFPQDSSLFTLAMFLAVTYISLLIEHYTSTVDLMRAFHMSAAQHTCSVLRGGVIRKHTSLHTAVAGDLVYLHRGNVTPSHCLILHCSPTFAAHSVLRLLPAGVQIEAGNCIALLMTSPAHIYNSPAPRFAWRDLHRATVLLYAVIAGVLLLLLSQVQGIHVFQALPYLLTGLAVSSVPFNSAILAIRNMASIRNYLADRGVQLRSSNVCTAYHTINDLAQASAKHIRTSLLTTPSALSHSPSIATDCDITTAEDTTGAAAVSSTGWRVMSVIGCDGRAIRLTHELTLAAGASAILQQLSTATAAEETLAIYEATPPPPTRLLECIACTLPLHLSEDQFSAQDEPPVQATQTSVGRVQPRGRRRRSFFSQPQAEISIVGDGVETALYEYLLTHATELASNPLINQSSNETMQPRLAHHRSAYSSITLNSALSAACATDVEATAGVPAPGTTQIQYQTAVRTVGQFRDTHMTHWHSTDGAEMIIYSTAFGVVGAVLAGDVHAVLRRCDAQSSGLTAYLANTLMVEYRYVAYAHMTLVEDGYSVDGYESRLQTAISSSQQLFYSGSQLLNMRFVGCVTMAPPRLDVRLIHTPLHPNISSAIISTHDVLNGLPKRTKSSILRGDAITRQGIESCMEKQFTDLGGCSDPIVCLGTTRRHMAESILPSFSSDCSDLCMMLIDVEPIDEVRGQSDNALLLDSAIALKHKRLQDCQSSVVPITLCDEMTALPATIASVACVSISHVSQWEELLFSAAHYHDAAIRSSHMFLPAAGTIFISLLIWAFGGLPLALSPLHMIVAALVVHLPQVSVASSAFQLRLPTLTRNTPCLFTAIMATALLFIGAASAYVFIFAKYGISINELRHSLHNHFNASPHLNQDFSTNNGDVLSPNDQVYVLREVQTCVLMVTLLGSLCNCYVMKESRISILNYDTWTNKHVNQAAVTIIVVASLIGYSFDLVQFALQTRSPHIDIVLKIAVGYMVSVLVASEVRKRLF